MLMLKGLGTISPWVWTGRLSLEKAHFVIDFILAKSITGDLLIVVKKMKYQEGGTLVPITGSWR